MAGKESKIDKEKKALEKKLFNSKDSGWKDISKKVEKEIVDLSEEYKSFLNNSKTERQAIKTIAQFAEENGYVALKKANKGSKKFFLTFDGAAGALIKINDASSLSDGFLMNGAHIDVPRLDLKPQPLYEAEEMAFMKTHYYGGIYPL